MMYVGDRFIALNYPFHVIEILKVYPERCEYIHLDDKLKFLDSPKGQITNIAMSVIWQYFKRLKLTTQVWREVNA